MWGTCEDIFSLTIFQDSLYSNKLIKGGGSLPVTVGGGYKLLMNVFTAVSLLSRHTYMQSRIYSTCGSSPKSPISEYNRGSLSNGPAPPVWWYFSCFLKL